MVFVWCDDLILWCLRRDSNPHGFPHDFESFKLFYTYLFDEKKSIENQIVEISKKITPLAEEIKHCTNIQKRMDKIKKYELHQKLEKERQKAEQQEKAKLKNKYRDI